MRYKSSFGGSAYWQRFGLECRTFFVNNSKTINYESYLNVFFFKDLYRYIISTCSVKKLDSLVKCSFCVIMNSFLSLHIRPSRRYYLVKTSRSQVITSHSLLNGVPRKKNSMIPSYFRIEILIEHPSYFCI